MQTLRVNGTDSSTMSDASNEVKKELVVMDEQPSKFQLPQINMFSKSPNTTVKISDKLADYSSSKTSTGYSSANSTSPVSAHYDQLSELEQMKLKFYGEIASRLKNLLANNISLREVNRKIIGFGINLAKQTEWTPADTTTFDLDDVPFIDDDLDSNFDLNESQEPIHKKPAPGIRPKSTIFNDKLIEQFSQDICYTKLEKISTEYLSSLNITVWQTIAAIFELILQTVIVVEHRTDMADDEKSHLCFKLKETAASYVHDKYCDWIFENGGWVRFFF